MGLFDRLFRRGSLGGARRAELTGDLGRAIELFAEAGQFDEVARVMIVRGDAEPEASKRLQHYTQAVQNALEGGPVSKMARRKRALLTLSLAGDGMVTSAARADILEAAAELERLGEADRAAEAYALAHDTEGQARALAEAGHVDELETLLTAEQSRTSGERLRSEAHGEIETLIATGRRREALAAAERLARSTPLDASARERILALTARRAGGLLQLLIRGRPVLMVVEDELVVGRTEGALVVTSTALSRRHVAIGRSGGDVVVRDLGSRNGTLLRGMRVAGALPLGEGLELLLGGEVKLGVAPSKSMEGALDVDLAGQRYVASLGPAVLGVGGWRLVRGADGWVELATGEGPTAFQGDLALTSPTTLLVGDRFAEARGGPPVLEILGAGRAV